MAIKKASFAAGCFWGVEARFRQIPGVLDAAVGYMGGEVKQPNYHQVCTGSTGHAEAVQLEFDDSVVSYRELLGHFFDMHNPTTLNRQGPDRGTQYRSAIYYHEPEQKDLASELMSELGSAGRWPNPIVTELQAAPEFWRAEEYHQQYLAKNGRGFCAV